MYLNKLLIKDFGKFNNKELELRTGINLIYGAKDSGKTSVKDFIVSMLYGIDRSRGIGNTEDIYELRKPADRKGYSGKAYIQSNNNKYFIERSFLRRNRTVNVMDVQSGREVKLDTKDSLQGTLVNIDKETYKNALCIDKPVSGKSKYIAKEMDATVDAVMNTGTSRIAKQEIMESLNEARSKYDLKPIIEKMDDVSERLEPYADSAIELKKVRTEIKNLDEEFATEAARRKRQARKMIETEDGQVLYRDDAKLNQKLDKVTKKEALLDAVTEKKKETKVKLTDQLWFIALIGLLVVGVIALMVKILGFDKGVRQLFIICTVLFVIVTIIEDLFLKGVFDDDISAPSEEEFNKIIAELEQQAAAENEDYDEDDEDMHFATEYAEKKAILREKEQQLDKMVAKKTELETEYASLELMKDACEKERKAIALAMETINAISEDINEELVGLINGNTSDIVSKLTNGKCTDVKYDKKNHLSVCVSGDYIGITELKTELLMDVCLSVNLAMARYFSKSSMPIILDDVIDTEDENKLFNIVECLNTINTEQIIILSSDARLAEKLNRINISYNMVELA